LRIGNEAEVFGSGILLEKFCKSMEFFGEKHVFLLKSWQKSQKIDKKVILVDRVNRGQ
jgi:hypothetical protein